MNVVNVKDEVFPTPTLPHNNNIANNIINDSTCVDCGKQPPLSTEQFNPTTSNDNNSINKTKNKRRQPKYRATKRPHSERRFQCDQCESRFFTQKDVKRHMVVHTGVRNFACPFCEQRFGRKDHLVRHAKKSHDQDTRSFKRRTTKMTSAPTATLQTDSAKKTNASTTKKGLSTKSKFSKTDNSNIEFNYTTASTISTSLLSTSNNNNADNPNIYFNRDSSTTSFETYHNPLSMFSNSTSITPESAPTKQSTIVDDNCPNFTYVNTTRSYSANFDNYTYSNYVYNIDFNPLSEPNYMHGTSGHSSTSFPIDYHKSSVDNISCCLPTLSDTSQTNSSNISQVSNNSNNNSTTTNSSNNVSFKTFGGDFNSSIDLGLYNMNLTNFQSNSGAPRYHQNSFN